MTQTIDSASDQCIDPVLSRSARNTWGWLFA